MSGNNGFHPECNEEFAELCALSMTNALTTLERKNLEHHVMRCARCASLLSDFGSLSSQGMARVAAIRDAENPEILRSFSWDRDSAKTKFLSRIASQPLNVPARPAATASAAPRPFPALHILSFLHSSAFASAAALLLIALFLAYQFGLRKGLERAATSGALYQSEEAKLRQKLSDAELQQAALARRLQNDSKATSELERRAAKAESVLTQLQTAKAALQSKAQELSNQTEQQSGSLAALTTEREMLQQKLRDADAAAQKARQELVAAQDERQRALLRSTNLENEVDRLSAKLHEREAASNRKDQYLASDRDIRELMGARQLYIADVFDVDSQGKTRTPFGRVFYTRGKSLIFYAFDLDREPGYREARAFQAWGRPGPNQAAPISLGIFYMDNEANRRWTLKFDDPKVLGEINSVFVTVEPKGGSKKPTNKPFLLAYLHTAPPNHP